MFKPFLTPEQKTKIIIHLCNTHDGENDLYVMADKNRLYDALNRILEELVEREKN